MSTILENAKRFENQTSGMTRAEKIQWFGTKLGIDEAEMLRLIGYGPTEIAKQKTEGATFTELAEAKPDRTVWVSELLLELVDRSGYDWASLTSRLEKPAPAKGTSTRINAGSKYGVKSKGAILKEIALGGPNVLRSLTDYLATVRTV